MLTGSFSRARSVVTVCALLILTCASLAIAASNMGFSVVKPLVFAGAGQIGNNWTSMPYKSPYTSAAVFCSKVGLTTGLVKASITVLNENTGVFSTVSCGTPAANALVFVPGKGIQIRQPSTTGAPTSIVIKGSHDNALSITIPDAGAAEIGSFWFSVPYHTTSVTAADLCLDAGLSTGVLKATITRLNAATGVFSTVTCGTAGASSMTLHFGEFVKIREPDGPKTFTPSHY